MPEVSHISMHSRPYTAPHDATVRLELCKISLAAALHAQTNERVGVVNIN